MWEALAGAVLGNVAERGIAKVFGDEDQAKDQATLQRIRNENLQREFAQHGIRWRVADAQAAGVHPLFALSGGGAAFAPNPITVGGGGFGGMGQDISRAVMATANNKERELREKLLQAQIDHTNAQTHKLLNPVQAAPFPATAFESGYPGLEGQDFRVVSESPVVQVRPGAEMAVPGAHDVVKPTPSEQVSARSSAPYIAAGLQPAMNEYRVTKNMAMMLPGKDISEALESMAESWGLAYAVYQFNKSHYGEGFDRLLLQELNFNPKLRAIYGRFVPISDEADALAHARERHRLRHFPGVRERGSYAIVPWGFR